MAVEAAGQEASGPDNRATLTKYLIKERELDNSSKPNQTKVKGSPPEKILRLRKSYSLYLRVMLQRELMKSVKMMMEQHFSVLRVKHQKASLNRRPVPLCT
jgi:hypothetical protein